MAPEARRYVAKAVMLLSCLYVVIWYITQYSLTVALCASLHKYTVSTMHSLRAVVEHVYISLIPYIKKPTVWSFDCYLFYIHTNAKNSWFFSFVAELQRSLGWAFTKQTWAWFPRAPIIPWSLMVSEKNIRCSSVCQKELLHTMSCSDVNSWFQAWP